MPLLTLDRVSIAFGHVPLLDSANLQIEQGERVCIIGRNGTGKSTLLQVAGGLLPPDAGTVWRQPDLRIGRLAQDAPLDDARTVFEAVADGLGDLGAIVAAYHHAAVAVSERGDEAALALLGQAQHELEERDGWRLEERVELVIARLLLPADAIVNQLSGGWRRRVLLARALVSQPDLLLLDEPTNHLDIESMTWLETFLEDYPGAVLFVTHDRVFLQRLATRIVELDRGRLTSWLGDYETFLRKKDEWLSNESIRNDKFDKKLAEEEAWLRQGIKARRTRNEGRVKALEAMRAERAERRNRVGNVNLQVEVAERSGQMVFEAKHMTKGYGGAPVVGDLSLRIIRGDRVGLIGPNGSGKTTLLRLLVGELLPDAGEVRHGANVQIAYYDQQREQLDLERTVFDTVGDGSETVTVNGRVQHVHGYLRDFLFPAERALSPVKALSGGERNRLLLARLFTRPVNVIVLDEPTNDLDIETLELLEEKLTEWPGTLLLVSHDRAFIDHVVTSTLVFEGHGKVKEYVGGYEDWLRQRDEGSPKGTRPALSASGAASPVAAVSATVGAGQAQAPPAPSRTARGASKTPPKTAVKASSKASAPPSPRAASAASPRRQGREGGKPSNRERLEYETLPARIEGLEAEQARLNALVASEAFYREAATTIRDTLARLEGLAEELLAAYARWDELDSKVKER